MLNPEFYSRATDYEKLLSEVVATEELLKEFLSERKVAEVIIGEYQGSPVGFALFFMNFSTFLGRPGIYLEDIYIKPEMRRQGFGKILLSFLAKLAVKRGCGRFEWSCFNWNKPSIKFYEAMGAVQLKDWVTFRLTGKELQEPAARF